MKHDSVLRVLTGDEARSAIQKYKDASDKVKSEITLYEIYAHPDVNEGKCGALIQGYLMVHSADRYTKPECYAEDFCFHAYGIRVAYVMGAYPVLSWRFKVALEVDTELTRCLEQLDNPSILYPYAKLLGVVECLSIRPGIWHEYDMYNQLGYR